MKRSEGILDHPRWDKGCRGCDLFEGAKLCPIRTNRSLLKGRSSNDATIRSSVTVYETLIALAAANDQHVPLRQISDSDSKHCARRSRGSG